MPNLTAKADRPQAGSDVLQRLERFLSGVTLGPLPRLRTTGSRIAERRRAVRGGWAGTYGICTGRPKGGPFQFRPPRQRGAGATTCKCVLKLSGRFACAAATAPASTPAPASASASASAGSRPIAVRIARLRPAFPLWQAGVGSASPSLMAGNISRRGRGSPGLARHAFERRAGQPDSAGYVYSTRHCGLSSVK